MKHKKIIGYGALLLLSATALMTACKKNTLTVSPFEVSNGKGLLKINYASPYAKNPGIQIKIDGARVSNLITYATPYPGGGLNTGGSDYPNYLALTPGTHTVALSVPKVGTSEDSIPLYSTSVTLNADEFKTLHVSDTLTFTKSIETIDFAALPDSGYSKFRFVNLIPGSNMDIYFNDVLLKGNVGYNVATDTFRIVAGTVSQFKLRVAGSLPTSTPLATYGTGSTTYAIPNQRSMTIFARGYTTVAGSDIRRPLVSLLFNK